jgi:hypothetical protein
VVVRPIGLADGKGVCGDDGMIIFITECLVVYSRELNNICTIYVNVTFIIKRCPCSIEWRLIRF